MKKLVLVLFIGACVGAHQLYAVDEPVQISQGISSKTEEELDPIKRLRKAYLQQRRPIQKEESEDARSKKPTEKTTAKLIEKPTWKSNLFSLASTYVEDAGTSYALGYAMTYVQDEKPNHKALIKSALIDALRIPSILDAIYRIPFKIGFYSEPKEGEKINEGYEIGRRFVEDATVSYAVNLTYSGLMDEKINQKTLIAGSLITACRLPFIADWIAKQAIYHYISD